MNINKVFKLNNNSLPAYIIAEIAQAHDGSLGFAHSFIDLASSVGCDAVKFQVHIASDESSRQDSFRTKFTYLDETRFQYWQRMEFTIDEWLQLKKHAEDLGLEFICSVFSIKAFLMMKKINLKIWKIASGEIFNEELLKNIASQNSYMIISNGIIDINKTKQLTSRLSKINKKLALLHCNSLYPTPIDKINLNQMLSLKSKLNFPIGYSDHSGNPYTAIAAITLGAQIVEIHLCFNKLQFGPDTSSSLSPMDIKKVIEANKIIYLTKGNLKSKKSSNKSITKVAKLFTKSVGVNKNLKKGHILKKEDLCLKKPGTGIKPKNIDRCIGKKINRDISFDEILFLKDLKK